MPWTSRPSSGGAASSSLGRVRLFYMAGAPIPRPVAERFLEQGIKPQNIYGMTENSSHHYTHPDDDAGHHLRELRPRRASLRGPDLRSERSGPRGPGRHGRPDRRPGRGADARLFRQPGGNRAVVQQGRLVPLGRSRHARRAGQSADRRPAQGHGDPGRPQHPSGQGRGAGAPPSAGRQGRRLRGPGRAARRAALPRGQLCRRRAAAGGCPAAGTLCRGALNLRHAGVFRPATTSFR